MKFKIDTKIIVVVGLFLIASLSRCITIENEDDADNKKDPKENFDLVKAKAEIQTTNDAFCKLVGAKDSVGLTKMYTKDAKFMGAGGPSAVGHKQIQSAMHAIFESGITDAKIMTKEVFGDEDLLVEESNVLLYVEGQQVADEKAIVVWKKVDGKWKLFRDIFNSNMPAE